MSVSEQTDDLFGSIRLQNAPERTRITRVMDLGETRIQFAVGRDTQAVVAPGDTVLLEKIMGRINVQFNRPIPFTVESKEPGPDARTALVGCTMAQEMQTPEKGWDALVKEENRRKATPEPINSQEFQQLLKVAAQSAKQKSRVAQSKPYARAVLIGAVCIGLLLALTVLLVTRMQRDRMQRLEAIEDTVRALPMSGGAPLGLTEKMDRIEGQLNRLTELTEAMARQQNENARAIADLGSRIAGTGSARVPPDTPNTAVAAPAPPPRITEERFHEVQEGENLYRISLKYGLSVERLCELNGISPDAILRPGQKLKVP